MYKKKGLQKSTSTIFVTSKQPPITPFHFTVVFLHLCVYVHVCVCVCVCVCVYPHACVCACMRAYMCMLLSILFTDGAVSKPINQLAAWGWLIIVQLNTPLSPLDVICKQAKCLKQRKAALLR